MFHVFKETFDDLYKDTLIKQGDILTYKLNTDTMRPAYCLLVDKGSKSILLLLRGTRSVSDLVTDLHVSAKAFKDGYCHHGMLHSAQWFDKNLKTDIEKALKDHPDFGLKIIGHSLGAGVAVVLTILWSEEFNVKCYSLGCPSVLSQNLASKYSNKIVTIVNGDDIVPRLSLVTLDDLRIRVEAFNHEHQIHDKFSGWRRAASYILSGGYNDWIKDKKDIVDPYVEVVDLSDIVKDKEIPLYPAETIFQIFDKEDLVYICKMKPINYNEIVFTSTCKEDHHLASYRSALFKYKF